MRLLIVGETWISHSVHLKGVDSFSTTEYVVGCTAFVRVLEGRGWEVTHLPSDQVGDNFPGSLEALRDYACVFLSDVGANTFQLTTKVFKNSEPDIDRLAMLADYVRGGGGLVMVGGYLSFAGIEGKARYAESVISDLLPVSVSRTDDRRELPSGASAEVVARHPLTEGWDPRWPLLLGYNKTVLRPEGELLVAINGDPLVAIREVGAGRTAVFTSDMSAHWAPPAFMDWEGYGAVWDGIAHWVSGAPLKAGG